MNYLYKVLTVVLLLQLSGCNAQKGLKDNSEKKDTSSVLQKSILFIAIDDLKPLISAYGETQMHTPNIDRLAKMGVLFENANVQQAVCGPSRASIMTAMYPDNTKVWDLHTDFRKSAPNILSMPEYLITQGYETTAVGKIYHKGSTSKGHDGKSWSIPHTLPLNFPNKYGKPMYAFYQNPETKNAMQILKEKALAKGLKKYGVQSKFVFKKLKPSTECIEGPDEMYQDGLYTLDAIQKLKKMNAGTKPFFLGVGFQKPHLPFVAPKKYWDLYKREDIKLAPFQKLAEGTPKLAYHSFGEIRAFSDIDSKLGIGDLMPEAKQRELIHGYMACVSYVDAQVGKLLEALENENILDETVIVLWGDHGYHLGDHSEWCKHSNFEQATRIPLLFAGPGVQKNKRVTTPVELVDVFPTLFDLSGVKTPNVDGKSLVPLLDKSKETTVNVDYAVSQYPRMKDKMGYSLRSERYRYTEWHSSSYRSYKTYSDNNIVGRELYDYEKDPNETKNLVEEKAYQTVVKDLKAKLIKHLTSIEKR
jgi:arylsulfatase A-like enzyme